MNAILHHNGVRVQGSTDKNFLMVCTPECSFEILRERVGSLRDLLGVALAVTEPPISVSHEVAAGPDNVLPIMARKQAD